MNRWRLLGLVALLLAVAGIGGCFLFPNHPPVASFTVEYNTDPHDQLVVVLNASESADPDGDEIVGYMWTLGDNNVEILSPLDTTKTVNVPVMIVKYRVQTTNSKVELVVVDSKGAMSDPVSHNITVPVPE